MTSLTKCLILSALLSAGSLLFAVSDWQNAAELRESGDWDKAERLLRKYASPKDIDRYSGSDKVEFLRGLLELAHLRVLKDDVSGALALLNWAESRPDAYQRAIACLKYAEILLDLEELERAKGYLGTADELIGKQAHDRESGAAIGQAGERLDTGAAWRELRDAAAALRAELESEELKNKFGATYGSYVKLRRLQQVSQRARTPRYRNEALRLADEIIATDPASQFAAAAAYLKGELLAAPLHEDSPKKEIKEVKDYLESFVKSHPDGLYRGEALMLLGKISLELEWNARDAEKHYIQALDYFRRARAKRDAISLYAPLQDDLKQQIEPTQKPTTLNQWKRIVYHDEDPLKLYNVGSAPVWYIDDKELETHLRLGFLAFHHGQYEKAQEFWEMIPKLSSELQGLPEYVPSMYTRLTAAAQDRKMVFTADHKAGMDKSLTLLCQYAEFLFLQERFEQSEEQFQKIVDRAKNKTDKAVGMLGIGRVRSVGPDCFDRQRVDKYFLYVLDEKDLTKSPLHERALYSYADYIYNFPKERELLFQLVGQFEKLYPNSIYYLDMRGLEANAYALGGDFNKAYQIAQAIKYRDEDFHKVLTISIDHIKSIHARTENQP